MGIGDNYPDGTWGGDPRAYWNIESEPEEEPEGPGYALIEFDETEEDECTEE